MPQYDYEDDDQADDYDQDEAGAYDDDGEIGDAEYVTEISDLLRQKFGIDLPDHVTPSTFLRDMLMALHGHPGQEAAKLSHRRKRKRKQLSQGRRQSARTTLATRRGITAERGQAAAAEQLKNSRL